MCGARLHRYTAAVNGRLEVGVRSHSRMVLVAFKPSSMRVSPIFYHFLSCLHNYGLIGLDLESSYATVALPVTTHLVLRGHRREKSL